MEVTTNLGLVTRLLQHGPGSGAFKVVFRKRGDQTLRFMRATLSETTNNFTTEDTRAYDPAEHDLVCVFDTGLRKYRMINLRELVGLHMDTHEPIINEDYLKDSESVRSFLV